MGSQGVIWDDNILLWEARVLGANGKKKVCVQFCETESSQEILIPFNNRNVFTEGDFDPVCLKRELLPWLQERRVTHIRFMGQEYSGALC
jgi:hypothetical protein